MIERREFLIKGGVFAFAATPLANGRAKAFQRGIMQTNVIVQVPLSISLDKSRQIV